MRVSVIVAWADGLHAMASKPFKSMTMHTPRILIIGGNGRLGAAAAQAFIAHGWQVMTQVRRAPAQTIAGVTWLTQPLSEPLALADAAGRVDAVLHAANPFYTRWDSELARMTEDVLAVTTQLRARLLMPGNVYAYGHTMPPLLDEDTEPAPSTRKGQQRLKLEQRLAQHAKHTGLPVTVLRAGDFYGPTTGTWLDLMIAKDLHKGVLTYPGRLDAAHAWGYLPDLAQTFVAVAQTAQQELFETLHFPGHTLTGRELLAALEHAARENGITPQRFKHKRVPWPLLGMIGLVNPMLRELHRMRYLWHVPHALDGTRLQQRIGKLPNTPVQQALAASLMHRHKGA